MQTQQNPYFMKFGLVLFFNFLCISLFGQPDELITKWIKEVNTALKHHQSLYPYADMQALKDFGLSDTLFRYSENEMDPVISANRDSVHPWLLIEYFDLFIQQRLIRILNHPNAPSLDYDQLFDKKYMGSYKSEDGKFFELSYFENTGGTYQSYPAIYIYKINKDSLIYSFQEDRMNDNKRGPFSILEDDAYYKSYTLPCGDTTKYLFLGYIRECSYCFREYAHLVYFNGKEFVSDFYYQVDSRHWSTKITFDPEKFVLSLQYKTDDLTSYCHCNINNFEDHDFASDDLQQARKNCKCIFRFNGSNFVLEKSSEKEIIEVEED